MNKFIYIYCVCLSIGGCSSDNSVIEKRQVVRNNIINVYDKITEFEIDDVLIGGGSILYLIHDHLFILDPGSQDKYIHVFDKDDFNYKNSIAERGQGPGEITNIGVIAENRPNNLFYVSDHGKQRIFSYHMDSIFINSGYIPDVKIIMNDRLFPSAYQQIDDSISIGVFIEPIGNSDFKQFIARWNINTNDVVPISHNHPEVRRGRIGFTVSNEHNLIVECYTRRDLMAIYDLDGNLKYNIYGPNWKSSASRQMHCYHSVILCRDRIVAAFSGKENSTPNSYNPTHFLVFSLEGDYLKTLDVERPIVSWCYDEDNNRIIMHLDSEVQFSYLDLDGIV